jgi:hypothetical protein
MRFQGLIRAALFCVICVASAAPAAAVDFGDDASEWANDGECDDPRFAGPGMTETSLLDADILHDATDCRQAYDAGRLTLKSRQTAITPELDFGDDDGKYANDGECDDPRFEGDGMTTTTLLASDILHDATDCRQAYEAGRLTVR